MVLIAAHLNAGHSGGDSVAIGICPPTPHFSPSLISRTVSVDVKHRVYFPVFDHSVIPRCVVGLLFRLNKVKDLSKAKCCLALSLKLKATRYILYCIVVKREREREVK